MRTIITIIIIIIIIIIIVIIIIIIIIIIRITNISVHVWPMQIALRALQFSTYVSSVNKSQKMEKMMK